MPFVMLTFWQSTSPTTPSKAQGALELIIENSFLIFVKICPGNLKVLIHAGPVFLNKHCRGVFFAGFVIFYNKIVSAFADEDV